MINFVLPANTFFSRKLKTKNIKDCEVDECRDRTKNQRSLIKASQFGSFGFWELFLRFLHFFTSLWLSNSFNFIELIFFIKIKLDSLAFFEHECVLCMQNTLLRMRLLIIKYWLDIFNFENKSIAKSTTINKFELNFTSWFWILSNNFGWSGKSVF